jgi:hypothetical protein
VIDEPEFRQACDIRDADAGTVRRSLEGVGHGRSVV